MKQCTKPRCGSMALNLHKQGIETTLCDVCYWQDQSVQKDAEIAALRAQLEAVGAGGVSGRLMGAQLAEPYDQTSLELCSVCGWKALIPGDCCLNCERDKTAQPATAQPSEPADLTWCGCGDGYLVDSFDAGVMSVAGKCSNCLAAQPAEPETCFCDENNLGVPGVSCGDCPIRDYKTTQPQQSAATEQVLRETLKKLLGQVNNIEVLGEWVATDKNKASERKLRAQVDAVIKECRAAINPTGGTTP